MSTLLTLASNVCMCIHCRSIQVDHQLFALSKLDITGDGREEVIACSWVNIATMISRLTNNNTLCPTAGWTNLYY